MSVETSSPVASTELTLERVRDRRDDLIQSGFGSSETTLIEALPVAGKSYGVIKWAASSGNQLTVLGPRHTLLDEYAEYCEELGLDYWRVPSFFRDCESFDENGEAQTFEARKLKKEYEKGKGGEQLHAEYSELSCQQNGPCQFTQKKNSDPTEYSVLLGTYRHAFVEDWVAERYVAFDEFPQDAFLKEFDNGVAPIVTAYLEETDAIPYDKYWNFIKQDENLSEEVELESWKNSLDQLPSSPFDFSHVHESANPSAHILGPILTLAQYEMESLDNDWKYAPLGGGRVAVRNPKEDNWTFLLPPDLDTAESVIALDGAPNKTLWELVLNKEINHQTLLDENERETYLKEVLGYRFIQTTEHLRAIQGRSGASPPKDMAYIEGVNQKHEQQPSLISSKKGIRQYKAAGLEKITKTVEYYGNLKGMNDFKTERLGIVLGSPHPSDNVIEKWAALAGESAERKETNGDPDFGQFGNIVRRIFVHDEVFQAAMRFGRAEEDGIRGATVYIHTSALPEWLPTEKLIPDIHSWMSGKAGMKDTISAIRSLDAWNHDVWSATDLYDHTSVSKRQVRNRLDDLEREGYIYFEGKWGQGEPKHYTNVCLEDAGSFGHVEFPE